MFRLDGPATVLIWLVLSGVIVVVGLTAIRWRATAQSLRQVIDLSPQVCEICATSETWRTHRDPNANPVLGMHAFVPGRLVFHPGYPRSAGDRNDRDK